MFAKRTAVFLSLLCVISAQTTEERCNSMIAQVNKLKAAIEAMCSSSAPSATSSPTVPPTMPPYSPYKWTSVARTRFGHTNLQHAGTLSYTIPSVIPSSAREVLILVSFNSGYSIRGPYQHLRVFTQEGTTKYKKYITVNCWNQNAQNTNSDNMWFPMPPNRRVYLTVPVAHGMYASAELSVIGYR